MSLRVLFPSMLAVLALLAAGAARAAPGLSAGSVTGAGGSEVVLPVHHAAGGGVVALQVDVAHDAALLLPGTVRAGFDLGATDHEVHGEPVEPGRYRVLVLSRTNTPLPEGLLFELPFTIDEAAPPGDLPVSFTASELVDGAAVTVAPSSLTGGTISVVSCLLGDVFPVDAGDAAVTLADYVQARREVAAGGGSGGRYLSCGDAAPGAVACDSASPQHWCPSGGGDGSFDEDDLAAIRRLAAGTLRQSCEACLSAELGIGGPFRPGDVAPRGAPDGLVNVQDVLLALRFAVGLELAEPDSLEFLATDVAPATESPEGRVIEGDGELNVSDVLLLLRHAVGLEVLLWGERTLTLSLETSRTFVAFSGTISGVPPWAEAPELDGGATCAVDGHLDEAPTLWAVTCVEDPAERTADGLLASIRYRAPQDLDPAQLGLRSALLGADLAEPVPDGLVLGAPTR